MRVIKDIINTPLCLNGSVVTIGVFDAIHLGHRVLINKLIRASRKLSLPSVLITFDPSPKEVLYGYSREERLLTAKEKLGLIRQCGIDYFVSIRFTRKFSTMAPREFVKNILVKKLGVSKLIVGEDFCLGRDKKGDVNFLEKSAKRLSFKLNVVKTVLKGASQVKSSMIRNLIKAGDLARANGMLGRNYSISGRVRQGRGAGRMIGYPTANISLPHKLIPREGIYASYSYFKNKMYNSITYVGRRPTFPGLQLAVETYIFNFSKDIYDKELKVEFLQRLRDDKKFPDIKGLTRQIALDIRSARKFFRLHERLSS
jgi:riboflavin kinase / FMN adenylyltransferase